MKSEDFNLEDINNAIIYDGNTKKVYCPQCGIEIIERKQLHKCPDIECGWREYMRNSVTGEKVFGD